MRYKRISSLYLYYTTYRTKNQVFSFEIYEFFMNEGDKMAEIDAKNKRCCFTGHRPEKLFLENDGIETVEKEIKSRLRIAVRDAVEDGLTTFITGMARGLDLWAADVVLEEKENNPDIKLICAVPFEGFEKRWNIKEQMHYQAVLEKADFVKIVCEHYTKSCFQVRNVYMVDRVSRVIAAFNGTPGGTRNTIMYAKKCGVFVVNILEDQLPPK